MYLSVNSAPSRPRSLTDSMAIVEGLQELGASHEIALRLSAVGGKLRVDDKDQVIASILANKHPFDLRLDL
jgi:hypothetical protein